MRMKKLWLTLGFMVAVLFGTGYALSGNGLPQNANSLALEVFGDKQIYLTGEMVSLHFKITNRSNASTSLQGDPTVWEGNLKVFIAQGTGPFREYFGPGWGTRDVLRWEPLKLLPGESFETDATVLWNQKVETSHLSELYAKKLARQRLNTDYAMSDAGQYYVKAVLNSPQTGTTVESAPLSLTIEEPQDSDLDIWKALKQNPDYALFIQTGGLLEHPKGPKTVKVAGELETLLSRHPDSHYANRIRQSLSKRQEEIEKMERDKE